MRTHDRTPHASGAPPDGLDRTLALLLAMAGEFLHRDPARALDCSQQAAGLARSLGDRGSEGRALLLSGSAELHRGEFPRAERHLEDALAIARLREESIHVAACLHAVGLLRQRQGRTDEAVSLLSEGLRNTTAAGSRDDALPVRAEILEVLGLICRDRGDRAEAMTYYQEALELRRLTRDQVGIANVENHVGNLFFRLGQFQEAMNHLRRALEARRSLDDRLKLAKTANSLALTLLFLGQLPEAEQLLVESRTLFDSLGAHEGVASALANLGLLRSFQGKMDEAEALYRESLELHRQRGDVAGQTGALNNLSSLLVERGQPRRAIEFAEECLNLRRRTGHEGNLAKPLFNMGRALLLLGHRARALETARTAHQVATKSGSNEQLAQSHLLLAAVLRAQHDLDGALREAEQAIRHAEKSEDARLPATCRVELARVQLERGEYDHAKELLEAVTREVRSLEPFERSDLLLMQGKLLARIHAFEAAAGKLRRADQEFARIGNPVGRIEALLVLSDVARHVDADRSPEYRSTALSLAEEHGLHPLVARFDEEASREAASAPVSGTGVGSTPSTPWGELASGLHDASSRQSMDPCDYLNPFFRFLVHGDRFREVTLRLEPRIVKQWGGESALARSQHFNVEAGTGTAGCTLAWSSGTSSENRELDSTRDARGSRFSLIDGERTYGQLAVCSATASSVSHEEEERVDAAARLVVIALQGLQRRLDLATSPAAGATSAGFEALIGSAPAMQDVYRLIAQVGPTDSTVLLLGESGTGKELAARSIHARSPRRDGPFVVINCPSIPRELIESELFGHEKGAFTGAAVARPGQVELADRGTLFLDEVGDLASAAQAKLLRFLQEREFQRVGGREKRQVDVRVLSATSRDLGEAMQHGEFREDLYYRLNVVPIPMPALRERRDDIPLLVAHLVRALEGRDRTLHVSSGALDRLMGHDWPGNVRELRNAIEYMIATSDGDRLEERHLPPHLRDAVRAPSAVPGAIEATARLRPGETLEARVMQVEASLIRRTLEEENWNQSAAARRLGLTESTIRYRMRQYGIRRPGGLES